MTMRTPALLLMLALVGCTGGPGGGGAGGMFGRSGERRGPPLRPIAQPTQVIAAEIALARAAREDGQWAALADRAAPGAQIAWNSGTADAAGWLAGQPNPATPDRWEAREAWSSCDGSAVVIAGIGHDAAGNWSRYTRVWERDGRDLRWGVTVWQPDGDLTRERAIQAQQSAADAAEDAIVVDALNMVRARVATPCTQQRGPARRSDDDAPAQSGLSRDGTLRWTPVPGAATGFTAWWQTAEGWEQVHAQAVPEGGA